MTYTKERIEENLAPKYQTYFAKLAVGQPANWKCDKRGADLFVLAQWLMDELILLKAEDLDKRDVQSVFNRKSRAEEDLYALMAKILNDYLDGKIERFRRFERK